MGYICTLYIGLVVVVVVVVFCLFFFLLGSVDISCPMKHEDLEFINDFL